MTLQTSGQISAFDFFYGADATSATVTVSGEVIQHQVGNGSTATATLIVRSDGTLDKTVGTTTTQFDASTDWLIPNASGAGYYARLVPIFFPPALTTGSVNTWQQLNTDRSYGYVNSAPDSVKGGNFTLEISSDASGTPLLDSATFTIEATVGLPI